MGACTRSRPARARRRRPVGWRALAAIGVAATALTTGAFPVGSAAAAPAPPAPIDWTPCPSSSGYQCGSLQVPLAYRDPSRGSVRLSVIELPVAKAKGVLVFNPGGPGESGVLILPILVSLLRPGFATGSPW